MRECDACDSNTTAGPRKRILNTEQQEGRSPHFHAMWKSAPLLCAGGHRLQLERDTVSFHSLQLILDAGILKRRCSYSQLPVTSSCEFPLPPPQPLVVCLQASASWLAAVQLRTLPSCHIPVLQSGCLPAGISVTGLVLP